MSNDNQLLDDFQRDGVVRIRQFFSEDTVGEIRAEIDRYIREDLPAKPADARTLENDEITIRNLWRLEQHSRYFREMGQQKEIMDLIAKFVNGQPILHSIETFNKAARFGSGVPHHQDNAYFCRTPADMVSVWVAIDPVTTENGAIYYIKGSHDRLRATKPSGVKGNSIGLAEAPDTPQREQYCATLQPGDATIHHCRIIHHSDPNRSTQSRLGLVFVYRGAHTRTDPRLQAIYADAVSETPPS